MKLCLLAKLCYYIKLSFFLNQDGNIDAEGIASLIGNYMRQDYKVTK